MIAVSERQTCRTLGEYIVALVARVAEGEPRSFRRLRDVVGGRVARIALDNETVVVRFEGDRLVAVDAAAADVVADGEGGTERVATLRLLDGSLEVTDAILQGRLDARGDSESLARIFQAIEILLDASTRVPLLPRLAGAYEADPCRRSRPPERERPGAAAAAVAAAERALLRRLDLLPGETSGADRRRGN